MIITSKYTEWRKCITCNEHYREKDNIGHLLCRIHPGLLLCDKRTNKHYYSCCGLYLNALIDKRIQVVDACGCVKIDHIDREFNTESISERLSEIRDFAVLVLPIKILEQPFMAKPTLECILYEHRSNQHSSHTIRYDLTMLQTVLTNTKRVLPNHNFYNHSHNYCNGKIGKTTHDFSLIEDNDEAGDEWFTLMFKVSDITERFSVQDRGSKRRRLNDDDDSNTVSQSSVYTNKDSWASIDDGDDDDQAGRRQKEAVYYRKSNSSFTVIRRIDNKLNEAITHYSKLEEENEYV